MDGKTVRTRGTRRISREGLFRYAISSPFRAAGNGTGNSWRVAGVERNAFA